MHIAATCADFETNVCVTGAALVRGGLIAFGRALSYKSWRGKGRLQRDLASFAGIN